MSQRSVSITRARSTYCVPSGRVTVRGSRWIAAGAANPFASANPGYPAFQHRTHRHNHLAVAHHRLDNSGRKLRARSCGQRRQILIQTHLHQRAVWNLTRP